MLPDSYFEVLRCPGCRSALEQPRSTELTCSGCRSSFPVENGIPVLLHGLEDEASETVKRFYDTQWRRNDDGELRAVMQHADPSDLGRRYVRQNEERFLAPFEKGGRFFLDAGCGATPRVEFGAAFEHHICLDLSLDALAECREALGDRSICVCGSLLHPPLATASCRGVVAAHSLYHVDRSLQRRAVAELWRLTANGTMTLLYSNPRSLERIALGGLRRLVGRKVESDPDLYFEPLSIAEMRAILGEECPEAEVRARHLRLLSKRITQPVFAVPGVGILAFWLLAAAELLTRGSVGSATYVAYVAKRRGPD